MKSLKLSPEEGFVLSRVDGNVSVKELVALTGFDEGRIHDIVGRLNAEGAIEMDDAPMVISAPPAAASSSSSLLPSSSSAPPQRPSAAAMPAITNELLAFLTDAEPPPSQDDLSLLDADENGEFPAPTSSQNAAAGLDLNDSSPDLAEAANQEGDESAAAAAAGGEEKETNEQLVEREARNEADYRKIFMQEYAGESRDFRIKAGLEVTGADLLALCFDPDPQIIHAVLTNPHAGLNHARLIAFHHRTQIGLESVAKRMDYLKDSLVQRRLLRNPQLPTTILNRIMNPKMLMDVYKVAIDREIPERSRVMTREILRKKFMLASSDEKAALLFKTEGRCLILLVSCTLDAHATNILCSKSNYTILFIQNLARWSATPPALLAHLLKLNVVRRNQGLAKMILKHPNTPSEAKKNFIR